MKHVGDTLKAMKSGEVLPRDAQHGSTTTDLTTSSSNQREQPLTESQLISVMSKTLRAPLAVSSKREKIYGRKRLTDEYGEYWVDNQIVDERDVFSVAVLLVPNIPERAIEAAHRRSPTAAYVAHLTRLSMHKILGSSVTDKTILFHDYATALAQFPDFVVWIACKWFWEKDPNKFFPKIAEIADLCEKILAELPRPPSHQIAKPEAARKPKPMREEESDSGKARRAELLKFMADHGDTNDYSNTNANSNYSLEGLARLKYGWTGYAANGAQGNSPQAEATSPALDF